jgi:hypothetical protein
MKLVGKRNVHVELPKSSYVKLKIASFERQLTTQDVFSGFTAMIADQDERAFQLLDELALMKHKGTLQKHVDGQELSDVDRALLYDLMEQGPKP